MSSMTGRIAAMTISIALWAPLAHADAAYLEQKCRAGEVGVCSAAAEAIETTDLDRAIELHTLGCGQQPHCFLVPLVNRLSARGQHGIRRALVCESPLANRVTSWPW